MQNLKDHFDDALKPGINIEAFKKVVLKLSAEAGEPKPSRSVLEKSFKMSDLDRSGAIDLDEFLKLYARIRKGEFKGFGAKIFSMFAGKPNKKKK